MQSELHQRRREPVESLAIAQKARTLLERVVAEHPEDIDSRIDLAKAQTNIGRSLQQTGDPVEALRSFQRRSTRMRACPN